jgi:hypothetical protein
MLSSFLRTNGVIVFAVVGVLTPAGNVGVNPAISLAKLMGNDTSKKRTKCDYFNPYNQ